MPRSLCVLVSHPPYGSIEPAEAIRHARGARAKGWEVVVAFDGDAVLALLPGQAPGAGEWTSLSGAMADLVQEGAQVLAEDRSLEARGLSAADLLPGARAVGLDEIARVLGACERTLFF